MINSHFGGLSNNNDNQPFYRSFRESKTFTQRCELSTELMEQFPNCVPVIVERARDETRIPNINKRQYLVPQEMTFARFFIVIRSRLGIQSGTNTEDNFNHQQQKSYAQRARGGGRGGASLGIWIYSGKTPITSPSAKMSEIYNYYKDNDGFLYLQYKGENVFG